MATENEKRRGGKTKMLGDTNDKLPMLVVNKDKFGYAFHGNRWYMMIPIDKEDFKWLDSKKDRVMIYENTGKEFDLSPNK